MPQKLRACLGALHSQNSRSTLPTPLHQLHSTPPFIVHSVWESSTPQIPEVQLPVPHRPNEQAAAQFSPPNFSHFHAGPACKLSSPFLFPIPPPVCARAEACTSVPPRPRRGQHWRAPRPRGGLHRRAPYPARRPPPACPLTARFGVAAGRPKAEAGRQP